MTEEKKMKIRIRYKDPDTSEPVEAATIICKDWSTQVMFFHWDKDAPKIEFISVYDDEEIWIFMDQPCHVDSRGYIASGNSLTPAEEKMAEIAKDFDGILA